MFKSTIFRKALFLVIGLIVIYTIILAVFVIPKVEDSIRTLEEENAKEALSKIVTISKNVYIDLESYKKDALEKHKQRLKETTDAVWTTLLLNTSLTKEEAIKTIKHTRYGKDGYFWINDFEPKMIMHPFTPYLDGKSLKDFKDPNGVYLFNEFVKVASKDGEGYVAYSWPKPDEKIPQSKISYVRAYPKFGWIIGTGVYIDGIDKEMQKRKDELKMQLKKIIKETKIGKTGYLYVFDSTGLIIAHPSEVLDGTSMKDLINPTTQGHLLTDLVQASRTKEKVLEYKWNSLSDKKNFIYEKIAWIEYIPELDWYVGSSVYEDDFKNSANDVLLYISIIAFVAICLAIFLSFIFLKNLLAPILKLSKFATTVASGNYSMRCDIEQNDEIGILAKEFNNMVLTVEDNVTNLQTNIEEEVLKNKKTQEQLFKSEKMAAMGEMIGNIAHQWRQPLSVITVAATGLQLQDEMGVLNSEKLHNACNSINKNAQYLSQTIDDFKNFIKGDREKITFNLKENIESFLQLVEGSIKINNIETVLHLDEHIMLTSYPNELNQCLINLFNNAKDVLKESDEEEKIIFIETYMVDNNVVIQMKDTGGGIPSEILSKIFEPYFTTKHQSQGTGLGLHMSYKLIVEGLAGTIEATNESFVWNGKNMTGAMFTIKFPL